MSSESRSNMCPSSIASDDGSEAAPPTGSGGGSQPNAAWIAGSKLEYSASGLFKRSWKVDWAHRIRFANSCSLRPSSLNRARASFCHSGRTGYLPRRFAEDLGLATSRCTIGEHSVATISGLTFQSL